MFIVFESIIYLGIIEEVFKLILEESGLKCGEDFFLVFLLERVDLGNKDFNIKNILKVVGGCSEDCIEVVVVLYRNILEGDIYIVLLLVVVEMEKILENIFRNINIGLVNEMVILCNRMGIDVWEVIDVVKIKLYGFMLFYLGLGLGGYCILFDFFYLEWKVKEYDYYIRLIEILGEINDLMFEFVLDNVMKILNKYKKVLNGVKVFVMGVVYKNDIDDYRELLVFKVIELFEKNGVDFKVNDFYCLVFKYKGNVYYLVDWIEVIEDLDIVIIIINYSCYDYEEIVVKVKVVYDIRNVIKNVVNNREKIYKL